MLHFIELNEIYSSQLTFSAESLSYKCSDNILSISSRKWFSYNFCQIIQANVQNDNKNKNTTMK